MLQSSHRSDDTPALETTWRARSVTLDAATTLATFSSGLDDESAPVVVLVHGLGHWTQGAWDAMVPYLAATHRIVAFDLPGFGASSKPDGTYSLDFFSRAVDAVVLAYGLRRFTLVGHSLGGLIAANVAARSPDCIEALVLLDPAGFLRTPKLLLRMIASRPAIALLGAIPPTRGWVRKAFETSVYDPQSITPAMHARMYKLARERSVRRAFARVYRDAMREFFDLPGLHARFGRFRGTTLIVWGREDRYIPLRALAGAERVYPHARVTIFGRCGHCPNVELPAQTAALIVSLARYGAGTALAATDFASPSSSATGAMSSSSRSADAT
jgi:pimeloyl-ACP methyl ester carboxylesterase